MRRQRGVGVRDHDVLGAVARRADGAEVAQNPLGRVPALHDGVALGVEHAPRRFGVLDARVERVLDGVAQHEALVRDDRVDHRAPPGVALLLEGPQVVPQRPRVLERPVVPEGADEHADVDRGVTSRRELRLELVPLLDEVLAPGDRLGLLDGLAEGGGEPAVPLDGGLEHVALAPFVEGVDEEEVLLAGRVGVLLDVADDAQHRLLPQVGVGPGVDARAAVGLVARRVVEADQQAAVVDAADAAEPRERGLVEAAAAARVELVDGVGVAAVRYAGVLGLDDVEAREARLERPLLEGREHGRRVLAHVAQVVGYELGLPVDADVQRVLEEGQQVLKVAAPVVQVPVLLLQQRLARVLAVPVLRPRLVRPGQHERHVGLAVLEQREEGLVHDGPLEPVVVVADAVETHLTQQVGVPRACRVLEEVVVSYILCWPQDVLAEAVFRRRLDKSPFRKVGPPEFVVFWDGVKLRKDVGNRLYRVDVRHPQALGRGLGLVL